MTKVLLQTTSSTRRQFGLKYLLSLVGVVCIALAPIAYWGASAVVVSIWLGVMGMATLHSRYGTAATILTVGVLIDLIGPAMGTAHEAARRTQCVNNMRQLAVAINNYEADHGHFPPPYVTDEHGKPMHGWRVLILPYLKEQTLYDRYDFSKAWDHPDNLSLAGRMPSIFRCPGDELPRSDVTTSYLAVVGDQTVWPLSGTRTVDDVTDGMANTLLLIESGQARTHWMAPSDITFDSVIASLSDLSVPGFSSNHNVGVSAITFCDTRTSIGHWPAFGDRIRNVLTCSGGETSNTVAP